MASTIFPNKSNASFKSYVFMTVSILAQKRVAEPIAMTLRRGQGIEQRNL
jgi:hypothetical protein